jgi:hypothetical protein
VTPEELLSDGLTALADGDHTYAEEQFRQVVVEADPRQSFDVSAALVGLGTIARLRGACERAQAYADEALQQFAAGGGVQRLQGLLAEDRADLAAAESWLAEAERRRNPDVPADLARVRAARAVVAPQP